MNFDDEYNPEKLKKVSVNGFSMYVAPRYIHHYVENDYEPFSSELVQNYINEGDIFLDIGAHYGYYSLLVSKSIKKTRVIAVEPVRENFEVLDRNFKLNKVKDAKAYNLAASNRKGQAKFKITEASDSAGFYGHPHAKTIEERIVRKIRIDELLKGKKADFIKIDVEGHEPQVLKGLRKTIKDNPNIKLLIEFNPKVIKKAGNKPSDLLKQLHDFDLELYIVDEGSKKLLRITENEKRWKVLMGDMDYCNIFCLKKEKSLLVAYFSHLGAFGGSERSLSELLTSISYYGALSHIVVPEKGELLDSLEGRAVSRDVMPYRWWTKDEKVKIGEYRDSFKRIIDHVDELKRINPHVVYTNTIVIPWGAVSALLSQKPHVWHVREYGKKDHGFEFREDWKEVNCVIDRLSDEIIFNSRTLQKYFRRNFTKNKGVVVYNNVEIPDGLENERVEDLFKSKKSFKLIIVGFLSKSKGQDQAVKAAQDLLVQGFDVELLILGYFKEDDAFYRKLRELVKRSKFENKIHIKNFVANPYPYIKQADALLMCSRNEAFGRVMVEAMKLGTPVIAANRGSATELIEDEINGLLYDYGRKEALVAKIQKLMEDEKKTEELTKSAKSFTESTFTQDNYAGEIFRLLMNLKGRKQIGEKLGTGFVAKMQKFLLEKIFALKEEKPDIDALQKEKAKNKYLQKRVDNLTEILDEIKSAKFFRLWQSYCAIRDRLLRRAKQ